VRVYDEYEGICFGRSTEEEGSDGFGGVSLYQRVGGVNLVVSLEHANPCIVKTVANPRLMLWIPRSARRDVMSSRKLPRRLPRLVYL